MYLKIILVNFLVLAVLNFGCNQKKTEHSEVSHNEHAGHNHDAHSETADSHGHDENSAHQEEAVHEDEHGSHESVHEHENEIELTPEAVSLAGIKLTKVKQGTISSHVNLSGEIGFNEDKLVHVTPRFAGIAKEAKINVGDYVKKGDVIAIIESNESMTSYTLQSSITGTVISKHILPGEHVSAQESIYTIADLSTVWVNLSIYPKDIKKVKKGQKVSIQAVGTDNSATGVIDYVTPVVDSRTRRITARFVLPNGNNTWRPGTFVNARIEADGAKNGLIIEKNAVQILNGKKVVFVSDEPNRFEPVEIVIGESDSQYAILQSGISEGTAYVSKGAFELKAKVVTSSLGEHAGHGH